MPEPGLEYETCYIFKPDREKVNNSRPTKRRKIGEAKGLHGSWPRRRALYEELWSDHESKLQGALNELNDQTVSDVSDFITDAQVQGDDPKIDSAILVTGPSLGSQGVLTSRIHQAVRKHTRSCFIPFNSGEATNLKAVLKRVNAVATSAEQLDEDEDGEEQVSSGKRGGKLLNYDLRISQQAVEDQGLAKVVIAFQDCEAFDGSLLSDVVELFSCWKDRIPFVLLFGVATSIGTLQTKLSRRAIRCLRARRFDATNAEATLENVFADVYFPQTKLWFGSGFSQAVLTRQRDFLANPQTVIDSVHYGYMTHFYSNALSLFLDHGITREIVPSDHFEAARNLPSFMQFAQSLLDQGKPMAAELRDLLISDDSLFERIRQDVAEGQQVIWEIVSAARLFYVLSSRLDGVEQLPESDIILQAMSGSLHDSSRQKIFFMLLKRASSTTSQRLLDDLPTLNDDTFATKIAELRQGLTALLQEQESDAGPLRSEVDIQNSTLRTTVISKKISLSKAKTTLTKADAAYSKILNEFINSLQGYFSQKLIDPKTLPFNEIFLFDLKSPHRQTFTPRPRHAIERALSSPHDYLNCECCAPKAGDEDEETTLASSQPPTAILYQLYLESGLMVNAADLRSAFAAILGDKVGDEDVLNALFQRSLAELSHLGLVKGTKKKADHLLKMAWKGL
ncbi:origin recognition complex subunit 3 [Elsinoe australis]|uniref:Origin recognition complex subunit 3 n=1 Tax=Elsinoe australis TaxID=40998 RepID=A0A4U7B1K3_9PEZI|nr:origin recognition complex subunit 3 [Elsinoe australis]